MVSRPITLGNSVDGEVRAAPELRSTHLHVIGGTGVGKSYFLEHMIRRDIRAGHGVLLIDPHGETYCNLVEWLARSLYRWPVHLLNPSDSQWSVGFNPLCSTDADPTVRADAMADACLKIWGTDEGETPRLSKCLRAVLYVLAVHRLSLTEAHLLTKVPYKEARLRLTADLPNEAYAAEWREFNEAYSDKQFAEYFESTNSRLLPFIASPPVQRMMGQCESVLNLRDAMDAGHVVLVNLAPKSDMTMRNGQLLGGMLFSDLLINALQRDVATAKRAPLYAYVDECSDYLTGDVARILDQTRKFGLHMTLAHQRMQQLEEAGPSVYSGVMESAKSKVVFQVDNDDSAEQLSRHLFRTQFELERPKTSMIRPTVVGQQRVWLASESATTAEAEAAIDSWSKSEGSAESSGQSIFTPSDMFADIPGVTNISGLGNTSGAVEGSARSRASSRAQTFGGSEGFENVYEDLPTILYSLEEMIHLGIVEIRRLPKRCAIVYLNGSAKPVTMTTPDVTKSRVRPDLMFDWVREVNEANSVVSTLADIETEIADRRAIWSDAEPFDPTEDDEDEFRAPN